MEKHNDMEREDWRPVVGMPAGYECNSAGQFRSRLRMPRERHPRPVKVCSGHLVFRAPNGRKTSISAARAVWQTFHGHIPEGMIVVKKNDMLRDHALENLQLSTPKRYSAKVGRTKNRKPVVQVENGEDIRIFPSVRAAASACYVHAATVWRHCTGQSETPLGANRLTFRWDDCKL